MTILLYIAQGLFALMGLILFLGFAMSKNIGLLFGGLAFGGAAFASCQLMAWWPLAVGLVATWVLRRLGFDPGAD